MSLKTAVSKTDQTIKRLMDAVQEEILTPEQAEKILEKFRKETNTIVESLYIVAKRRKGTSQ